MKDFDPAGAPLEGWNLLEANAGTGKTFSICLLYLRLMLEKELDHEQIVAITFTRVATSELRDRILQFLADALWLIEGGPPGDDHAPDLVALCSPFIASEPARQRLARALGAFDLAPISTIHGFCQRVLSEHAISTGFDPDQELVENEQLLLEPLVGRVWSQMSQAFSAPFADFLQRRKSRVSGLSRAVLGISERRYARFRQPRWSGDEAAVESELLGALERERARVASLWADCSVDVARVLERDPGLKQNLYGPRHVPNLVSALESAVSQGQVNPNHASALSRLTRSRINQGTKRSCTPPEHPFFDAFERFYEHWQSLLAFYQAREHALPLELWPLVCRAYADWKSSQGLMTYSDLVGKLADALRRPDTGARLAQALQTRYPAALVDEFQDTDPLQFEIFQRVFENACLWLVGDPKQALYGFRGADVFAYLKAREEAANQFRLTRDWRARPALIDIVNSLFSAPENPFVVPQIGFASSRPAQSGHTLLRQDGEAVPAMRHAVLEPTKYKSEMQRAAASACAAEIATLLARSDAGQLVVEKGGLTEPLRASDLAVLVRNRHQAALVAAELNARAIACVQPAVGDVFASEQAEDLERLMFGVLSADRSERVAGAAATMLVGADAEALVALRDDDSAAESWAERFSRWREVWDGQGLSALITAVLADAHTANRVLPRLDGRRRLANWFHVVELIEKGCSSLAHSSQEQLNWLRARRRSLEQGNAESLERLESQANVVLITTIHAAKGDQYPVTLCPFLWNGRRPSSNGYLEYHDDQSRLVLDFNSPAEDGARPRWLLEQLSEETRLAYVALTRAEAACWIAWGSSGEMASGGLHHVLTQAGSEPTDTLSAAGSIPVAVAAEEPAPSAAPQFPRHRTVRRRIRPAWEVASYSSLFGNQDLPRDVDELVAATESESVPADSRDLFALPAGARTGLMVHELLEHLPSFSLPASQIQARAGEALAQYGFDDKFSPALAAGVQRLLTMPLGPDGLRLEQVGPADEVREMAFNLSVRSADLDQLWQSIRGRDDPAPVHHSLRGYLRGFVDLVVRRQDRYFIIDYKSNHLGNTHADYAPEKLALDVVRHRYDLQFHLYALALHRLLTQRMSDYSHDRHFGGVLYLYLRGLDETGNGVHFARPDSAIITALNRLIS